MSLKKLERENCSKAIAELITQRSVVQIHPPQPILSIGCADYERAEKLPKTPEAREILPGLSGYYRRDSQRRSIYPIQH
jgi:hypothetical protein